MYVFLYLRLDDDMCMCIVKRGRRLIQSYRKAAWRGLDSTAPRVSLASTPMGGRKCAHTHTQKRTLTLTIWTVWLEGIKSGKPKKSQIVFLISELWCISFGAREDERWMWIKTYLPIYGKCCIKQGQEKREDIQRKAVIEGREKGSRQREERGKGSE